eukprot:TRINITY_DN3192_c0_g1_i1.p1 TRINITY_DN3192_c0_g1~~TRINITY_DN3192_c0_g1_i1.p1  ORF type:complete len:300 (-),score=75.90 TRINITY_DN3192_c0_g1_i1:37-936(-)
MDKLGKGWFSELGVMWPGQAMSIEVDEILFQGRSDYQDVVAFKSKTYGNVMALDGVIQCSERDEFSYQEMLTHLTMCAHPDPKRVLVIGGGDGGVLREVAKHRGVEKIVICEIDKMVIEVSKKYLPHMAVGYDDPRVVVNIGDGCKFLEESKNEYDIIIVDSSDPVGPAEVLFEKPFYVNMRNALRPGGIVGTQGECQWLHLELIKRLLDQSREIYNHVEYAYTTIPTYPCGQIGFVICSLRDERPSVPVRDISNENTRYYNQDVHKAAFVLPEFARKVLSPPERKPTTTTTESSSQSK